MNEPQRPESTRPPLAGFLPVVRRWRWMLLAAALAAGLAGYVTAAGSGRAYESRADILVGSVNTDDIDTLRASGQLAETYAELATSRPLLQATERRLGLSNVGSNITVTANATTRLLTIAARNSDKNLAAEIANTHAEELVGLAQRRRAQAEGPGTLQVVDPAVRADSAVGPDPLTVALLAALAGLLGALALALLLDRSGDAVREASDLERVAGVPCLATLPRGALRPTRFFSASGGRAARSEAAGAYRMLAAKVEILAGPGLVIVTLGRSGGVVAANLASALAATGARVAVVDAEGKDAAIGSLRGARAASTGGSGPSGSLALSAGEGDRWPREPREGRGGGDGDGLDPTNIRVVDDEDVDEAAREGAEGAGRLLAALLDEGDAVVVHAPPFQRSPTGLAWARVAEGTILVAERERTTSRELVSALESLRLVDARLVGTVLTPPVPGLRR
jgi:capsular polysaccharide biosynthesis protein/Mrp family chromosome partitioning ATPase